MLQLFVFCFYTSLFGGREQVGNARPRSRQGGTWLDWEGAEGLDWKGVTILDLEVLQECIKGLGANEKCIHFMK